MEIAHECVFCFNLIATDQRRNLIWTKNSFIAWNEMFRKRLYKIGIADYFFFFFVCVNKGNELNWVLLEVV